MSVYKMNYEGKEKCFQYDRKRAMVYLVAKATEEDVKENEDWKKKYGHNLWDINSDGYMKINSVGLGRENWDDKEARDEYLREWCFEMNEELAYMM